MTSRTCETDHTGLPSPQAQDDHCGRPEHRVVPKGGCPNHEALTLRPYTESFSQSKVENMTGIPGWLIHPQKVKPAPKFKRSLVVRNETREGGYKVQKSGRVSSDWRQTNKGEKRVTTGNSRCLEPGDGLEQQVCQSEFHTKKEFIKKIVRGCSIRRHDAT
jgi:hypothetical protein